MNEIKSSFTKSLDIIRNLLIVATTIYVIYLLWELNWIYAIIGAIPIYIILLNLYGFLTLPLYSFSPERKMIKSSKKLSDKYGIDIENEAKELLQKHSESNINEFSPKNFSEENFTKARECLKDILFSKDASTISYCKSYKSLKFSKESVELAFNYLSDSIKFDENCPLYQNEDFNFTLQENHMKMLLTYVNEEPSEIPETFKNQIKFVTERKIDIKKNQLKITEMINWRNNEQWKYFRENFGYNSELGKICTSKLN